MDFFCKNLFFCKVSLLISLAFFGRNTKLIAELTPNYHKGNFYFYWGYNRDYFGRSDIHFKGDDYNFTLQHVRANDRQSKLAADPYLHIDQLTIPQYNYRLGYFINDKYSISIGFDHMKYVMNQNQTVRIDGNINRSGNPYSGNYSNANMELKGDFLEFEHTDGLNYINVELSRTQKLYTFRNWFKLNLVLGASTGIMYPRTRVVLLNQSINDEWHFSGYGIASHSAFNLLFGKHIFLQTMSKAGFINMPNIVTTGMHEDRAKQHFFFLQNSLVLGYRFNIGGKKTDKDIKK